MFHNDESGPDPRIGHLARLRLLEAMVSSTRVLVENLLAEKAWTDPCPKKHLIGASSDLRGALGELTTMREELEHGA